jgi:malate dehydrogenase (oxaloacetate-decarboxylating)
VQRYSVRKDAEGRPFLEVPHRGEALLRHPMYSKGTAFSPEERAAFGLEGLLPDAVSSMEQQLRRVHGSIQRKEDPLERYIGLAALQDRNEHLFYRLMVTYPEELLPIVYTPTVGLACQRYSHIFRRGRGVWITPGHRGRMEEVLGNAPFDDVRLIVVTDNERILGLGDQGAGGMGIPIGKLAIYTAAAGIHPTRALPISLDVGTDNQELLADDLYLGWRQPRLRGPAYDSLVDEFVQAVKVRFPRALLQWEDFKKVNAFTLLERYRKVLPSFNDDIQGTAAVAVGGIIAGGRLTGTPLRQQRIVILGAGAAGIGIARLLRATLRAEGCSEEDLFRAIASVDTGGLLVADREIHDVHKRDFAWPPGLAESMGLGPGRSRDLEAVVRATRPTVLIGTSGQPGTFNEAIIRAMAAGVPRPLVLPMSNPTSQSEARPADVIAWTEGRALVATGSPFPPVTFAGRTHRIGQGNNAFIFPGMGLGALLAEAREITDGMFAAAARRLAEEIHDPDLQAGGLFPPVADIRRVTAGIAEAVIREACRAGVGRDLPQESISTVVAEAMWTPAYLPYRAI